MPAEKSGWPSVVFWILSVSVGIMGMKIPVSVQISTVLTLSPVESHMSVTDNGVGSLVQHTADLVEVALNDRKFDRKYYQYLPYPDNDFQELNSSNATDCFPLSHIYERNAQVFVPNQPVVVKSILAEKNGDGYRKFRNSYLYCIIVQHCKYEWTINKRYNDFYTLHKCLLNYIKSKTKEPIDALEKLLKHPKFRQHPAVHQFFEVTYLSFVYDLGISLKENYLIKHSSQSQQNRYITTFFKNLCRSYRDLKWFIVKSTYLLYLRSNEIRFPMLIDSGFQIQPKFHNKLRIKNLQHKITIKFKSVDKYQQWYEVLQTLLERNSLTLASKQNRFNSFAPIREKQFGSWFINGKDYMESLTQAILNAKEEIFIANWWLTPEIMLVRPTNDKSFRLDYLLGRKADEGVRVYVLIYKDFPLAMGQNSLHSKRGLIKRNRHNIKVIRHPNHYPTSGGPLLWSHHEKLVVIDQKIAYVSGIDLCFGRWDDHEMRLVDLGSQNQTKLKLPDEIQSDLIESGGRETVEAGRKVATEMAENSGNRFRTGTSEMQSTKGAKEKGHVDIAVRPRKNVAKELLVSSDSEVDDEEEENEQESPITSDNPQQQLYYIGKDYANLYEKGVTKPTQYAEDAIDRKVVPRMPWHDEGIVVFGHVAHDVARHFIQRWNIHKYEKYPENQKYPFLLPTVYNDDDNDYNDENNWKDLLNTKPFQIDAQCVRSVGPWSCRTKTIETSVANAYIKLIDTAKHFIYMENQFFISIFNDSHVRNQIYEALYLRIMRAHTANEKFRIYIVLPLLPGFDNIKSVQAVLYYIARSITKGDGSLYQRLEKQGVNHQDYISFYGMRNHSVLMGKLVTEIIYVHSKLMIVDDRYCICGSANINDRSLLGHRDSELCIVIKDVEYEQSDKQIFESGKFCSSWRKKLFSLLLGLTDQMAENVDLTDPSSDELYHYIKDTAHKNTLIYEEVIIVIVFAAMPSDRIRKFDQIASYTEVPLLKHTDPYRAQEELKNVRGFIVDYPIYFLHEEEYFPGLDSTEGFAPISMWV
ncbi:unnamed protein product [Didymodactylos carnosus]|uniref:Phospholipase n=1 Tax=Didymodactylos carnosus TaxID=1234261 RepID=A0A814SP36_9BILA|nr:unnamed protein product [Didymodactylos carnosus]CAF1149067.1 unnamed protein product [Didymodactylos carnosus]CAF3719237.1 unnamed protein product [Didymodactylos carnosus]CAF3912621.1 unnamed protein product [Didymodactylos carnosus]